MSLHGGVAALRRSSLAAPPRRGVLASVTALAGLVAAIAWLALPAVASHVRWATGQSSAPGAAPASIPAQARGVISTTLGSAQGSFDARPAPGGWRLAGGGVSAAFGVRGAAVRGPAPGESLALAVAAVGRDGSGGGFVRVAGAAPVARGNRVSYRFAGLREWFAAGPLGIEQGFVLERRPAGAGDTVTISLSPRSPGGALRAVAVPGGVRFVTRGGATALTYTGLSAVDATGRRLPATISVQRGRLALRVDDAGARYPLTVDPFLQQGTRLVGDCTSSCANQGTGEIGAGVFGYTLSMSADGTTILVGAFDDNGGVGAAWVFANQGGAWVQEAEITAGGEVGNGGFGYSVALDSNGDTAVIGAPNDSNNAGAVWVFTSTGPGVWTQRAELVGDCTSSCGINQGTGEVGQGQFGYSVAVSNAGTTALIGGFADAGNDGAAWVFTGSDGAWTQQGAKLVGDCASACANEGVGESGAGRFGYRVALDGAGDVAMIGAPYDSSSTGAAWVFTSSSGSWSQQAELHGSGESGAGQFGASVALDSAGTTALIGGPTDGSKVGAAWVFAGSGGSWAQQAELQGAGANGAANFGDSVALDGAGDTAIVGGYGDGGGAGAAWAFTDSGGGWAADGSKLVGDCTSACGGEGTGEDGAGDFGVAVAISSTGLEASVGAPFDDSDIGAVWMFAAGAYPPTAQVSSPSNGAGYAQGAVVNASFSCQAGVDGGALQSGAGGCAGTVADGQPIDTQTPGTHTFTVTATDTDGQTATATATYTVTAGAGSGGPAGGPTGGGPGSGSGSGSGCQAAWAGAIHVSGTTAVVPVRCAATGTSSRVALSLTVPSPRAKKAKAARKGRGHGAKGGHGKSGETTETVGSAVVTLQPGASATPRISLTSAGRHLLAAKHRLQMTLELTTTVNGRTIVVARRTVTFRSARQGKRKRHSRRR